MLSSNTTEERFNSTRTEGRDLYLTEIKSDIGEFSHLIDCHGVCGNNNEVSFVTNLPILHTTKAGKFRLNMKFPSLFHRRGNKQAAKEKQLYVLILYLNTGKHRVSLRNSRRLFLNRTKEDSRRYAVTVALFAIKKGELM